MTIVTETKGSINRVSFHFLLKSAPHAQILTSIITAAQISYKGELWLAEMSGQPYKLPLFFLREGSLNGVEPGGTVIAPIEWYMIYDYTVSQYSHQHHLAIICKLSVGSYHYYQPRSKADNVLASIRPSVHLFVCALPVKLFDIRGSALPSAPRCNRSHPVHTPSFSNHLGMVLTILQSPLAMVVT